MDQVAGFKPRIDYYGNDCHSNYFGTVLTKAQMKVPLDSYIVETLMPDLVGHDRQPTAFLVYLFLWYRSRGTRQNNVQLSLNAIAEGTGVSRRAVQLAITRLKHRNLIQVKRVSPTDVPVYRIHTPWKK